MLDYCIVRGLNSFYHATNILQVLQEKNMLGIAVKSCKLETDIEHNDR